MRQVLALALLVGCAGRPAEPVVAAVERSVNVVPTTEQRAPRERRDPSPWICRLGSGRDESALAVKDDGGEVYTMEVGPSARGPFAPLDAGLAANAFHTVIEGTDLDEPDLDTTFEAADVKRGDATRIVVYGLAARSGFSFGIALFVDPRGTVIGHAGWGMRVGNAHSCAPTPAGDGG